MSQELSSSDHARLTARAGELRDHVGELTAVIRQSLGTGHPATGKADEIDACFQRLQWALDRAHANSDGNLAAGAHVEFRRATAVRTPCGNVQTNKKPAGPRAAGSVSSQE